MVGRDSRGRRQRRHCGWRRQHQRCVVDGGDSVGIASWVTETASSSRRGWQRQRRRRRRGWRRAKTALVSHGGMWRQYWRCIVGGRDSIGVALWVAETAEATAWWVVEGEDSLGVASWVAETASALHRGRWRQRWHRVVGGGDNVGVVSWVAETTSASRCGRQRQLRCCIVGGGDDVNRQRRRQQRGVRSAAAALGSGGGAVAVSAKSDNLLIVCCKGGKKNGAKASKQAAPSGQEPGPLYLPTRRYQFPNGFAPSLGGTKPSKDSCYSGMISQSYKIR